MVFPADRKPNLEEALLVVAEAGYEIAKPGIGGIPKKWLDLVKVVMLLIATVAGSYSAGDLATRPKAATKEEVKQVVKEETPVIAAEVWSK